MTSAFYEFAPESTADDEVLMPTSAALSGWGADHLHGMAVGGALARAAEQHLGTVDGGADLRPARWTVDLFRAAKREPTRTRAQVVRAGRRLCVIDAFLEQHETVVARASALFLLPTTEPDGELWTGPEPYAPPTVEQVADVGGERLYSVGGEWGSSPRILRTAERGALWQSAWLIVDGEAPTAFQFAASVADVANMVASLGSAGVQHINPDYSMHLARLPGGGELGMVALDRVALDGLSVSSVVMFDRAGKFGTVSLSGLSNGEARLRRKAAPASESS